MAIDNDESISLPKPPPPRPARRKAAIEAALRKFDGAEKGTSVADPDVTTRPSLTWWARTHRPQFGVLVSAALIAVIGVPAALIAIRDQPPMQERSPPAVIRPDRVQEIAPSQLQRPEPSDRLVVETPLPPGKLSAPPVRAEQANDLASVANDKPREEGTPPASVAAAPPPPAPAPPPPPSSAQEVAAAPVAGNVVVTGTRIPQPAISAVSNETSERSASGTAQRAATSDAAKATDRIEHEFGAFLSRLQAAVRANDRRVVIKLIGFPLRVNSKGGTRPYRDAQSVERDYDRIFTPQVRQAILRQRVDQLFVRDQGAMIGSGEVWFDHTCTNAACSPQGPVRIKAVNL